MFLEHPTDRLIALGGGQVNIGYTLTILLLQGTEKFTGDIGPGFKLSAITA
jgi:hypothetical protein